MLPKRIIFFWLSAVFFTLVFSGLFLIRLDLFRHIFSKSENTPPATLQQFQGRDAWMNIFQKNRKIGFSHTALSRYEKGYRLEEIVFMRINTLGMTHDIHIRTAASLNPDFTLSSFDFRMDSGRFHFNVQGTLAENVLSITTESAGTARSFNIQIEDPPYLAAGMMEAVGLSKITAGDELVVPIFDPATMGRERVRLRVVGNEMISVHGMPTPAKVVSMEFKGMVQKIWISPNGEVLKEESLLGIRLEKTTRENALEKLSLETSEDLTQVVSVASNVIIENPEHRHTLVVEITGIRYDTVDLDGGRQSLRDNRLFIEKESLENLPRMPDPGALDAFEKSLLQPGPFIQSDHATIRNLTRKILAGDESALDQVKKLLSWIHENIEKRPVISLPDALSTLENKQGDCNEHAVLFAALARAAGFPTGVETGLVYLNGRFYYHAWNRIYLGRWITVDALFNQIPADVTHIRFSAGSPEQQLDLFNVIGRIHLKIIEE